jgi:hypothetical protein
MKVLKKLLIALLVLGALFYFVGIPYLQSYTKKYSPETTTTYDFDGTELQVHYSSPSKKGREIFGALVPYGKVWRTGANEPTTFTTSTGIKIIDKPLPAGTYSIWTIPNKESWKVIFNKEVPDWGVTLSSGGRETTRNEAADVLQVEVPVRTLSQTQENFTISFEDKEQSYLSFAWDRVKINVPLSKLSQGKPTIN